MSAESRRTPMVLAAGALALGAFVLVLGGCTPEFDPEFDPEIEVPVDDPQTDEAVETREALPVPDWCPTPEQIQEIVGEEGETWAYAEGTYECLLHASTETDWLTGQFLIYPQDEAWWSRTSVPPYGDYEYDHVERLSEELLLSHPGPSTQEANMCVMLMPNEEWHLDIERPACDLLLEIHDTLREDA